MASRLTLAHGTVDRHRFLSNPNSQEGDECRCGKVPSGFWVDSTGRRSASDMEVSGDESQSAAEEDAADAGQDAVAGEAAGLVASQRQRFWIEISKGTSSEEAAVAVGVASAVGCRWFREAGGMPPLSLAPLSCRYLSLAEREEIAILKENGCGVREIARQLRRSPSTISRELRRNAATRAGFSGYRAIAGQWHSDRRAKRPKMAKLAANKRLREYVQDRLSGLITRPDGTAVAGPTVRFNGRRHARRRARNRSPTG